MPCPPLYLKAMLAFAVLLLTGCTTLSPYSSVTKLNLNLSASDQVNPDLHGRPSPVVVRLFELKHPVAFENADFFSLYERGKESLAPDLVTSEELELRPGQRCSSNSVSNPAVAMWAYWLPTVTCLKANGATSYRSLQWP